MIDLSKYRFSIIYSVDVPKGTHLIGGQYQPPNFRRNGWYVTEDGPSEYDFSPKWKHRKYCAILDFQQFCDFLEHVGMAVEKTHTMGSLGAPGFFPYATPAVPFRSEDENAEQCAYVTPIPPAMWQEMNDEKPAQPLLPGVPEDVDMPEWETLEGQMWEWFDDGAWSARNFVESQPV